MFTKDVSHTTLDIDTSDNEKYCGQGIEADGK